VEDEAYCLLGIFGVNMPLLYGEGIRAFRRLQEEIIRVDEDYTIFAWSPTSDRTDGITSMGILANSPHDFSAFQLSWAAGLDISNEPLSPVTREDLHKDCFTLFQLPTGHVSPSLASRGLRIILPLLEDTPNEAYACLTLLGHDPQPLYLVCVPLRVLDVEAGMYIRNVSTPLTLLSPDSYRRFRYTTMYVNQPPPVNIRPSTINRFGNTDAEPILLVKIDPALVPHLAGVA
jgi:hypothetical protein